MAEYVCTVCGQKVKVTKNLFDSHNNKRNVICYGSFTPVVRMNPFKAIHRPQLAIADNPHHPAVHWHAEPMDEPEGP